MSMEIIYLYGQMSRFAAALTVIFGIHLTHNIEARCYSVYVSVCSLPVFYTSSWAANMVNSEQIRS